MSEVAELRALGMQVKEIADNLKRSAKTVGRHLESLHRKLGVRTDIELAQRIFRAEGFLRD